MVSGASLTKRAVPSDPASMDEKIQVGGGSRTKYILGLLSTGTGILEKA